MSANLTLAEQMPAYIVLSKFYLGFGISAVVLNAIILVVYGKQTITRRKYRTFVTLALADLLNGAAFVANAVFRTAIFYENTKMPTYVISMCTLKPWPALHVAGGQWPALITLVQGIERVMAVRSPVWYRKKEKRTIGFLLVASGVAVLASLAGGMFYGLVINPRGSAFFICSISWAFGQAYSSWNYGITIAATTLGFLLNVSAYSAARKHMRNRPNELLVFQANLALAFLSMLFVVFPNAFLCLAVYIYNDGIFLGYMYCFFCLKSCLNIVVFAMLNADFRVQFREAAICYRRVEKRDSWAINTSRGGGAPSKLAVEMPTMTS